MKRIIAILLAAVMVVCFAACGGKPSGGEANVTDKPAQGQQGGEGSGSEPGGSDSPANGASVSLDGSKLGVLQKIREGSVNVKGLLLTTDSGHHDYSSIQELIGGGYKTEGLYNEFFLNEWIGVYGELEGGSSVLAFVLPNDPDTDVSKLTPADLEQASSKLDYVPITEPLTPDPEDHGRMIGFYVHEELGEGLYNVFFCDGKDIVSVLQLKLVPQA